MSLKANTNKSKQTKISKAGDSVKFDLHVHSTASIDGLGTPSMIIRNALKRGLSGLAITDHNNNKAVASVRAVAPEGFIVIPGVEYATDHGHILALFCEKFAENVSRDSIGRFSLKELAPFIRENGGLLVAAHPYRYKAYLAESEPFGLSPSLLQQIDGMESVNARDLARSPQIPMRVEEAAKANGLFITGGSDGHVPLEIGGGYTEFPFDTGRDLASLRQALIEGQAIAAGKPGRKIYRLASRIWRKLK